ncbi:MAG: YihY/virulence factor BrkB family protein [Bacteroidota bacterium]|nr:YihY/virulence factor BrkB family protein [Bacteroidota bacterium]
MSEKIWQVRLDKVDKRQGFLLKQLRIFTLAVKGFNEDDCLTKATALTFYTLFSIVPILALIFAITKGFGYDKMLQDKLIADYTEYADILKRAFEFAGAMLSNTKGGLIAGVGVVLLLWSVMKLLMGIESNFNFIWEIKRGRSVVRRLTDYFAIMILTPVFLLISGGLTVAIQTGLGNFELLSSFSTILLKILAWTISATTFALLYLVMPNTKVNFKSAFIAGAIAMTLFQLLQWIYIKFQIGANSMNAIYGGFAALPLFLIWIQYSWYIVLFGAELSFANQNVDHYELENDINKLSTRYRKAISLMVANIVAKRFYNGEESHTAKQIATKLDLPLRLVRNVINEFLETGIFIELKGDKEKESTYQPGLTESQLTVRNILNIVDEKGVNTLPINDSEELRSVNLIMGQLHNAWDNPDGNKLVKDIA